LTIALRLRSICQIINLEVRLFSTATVTSNNVNGLDLKHLLAPIETVGLFPSQDSASVEAIDEIKLGTKIPAVTTVLRDSMNDLDAVRLFKWKKKKIHELGIDGYERLNRATLDRGTNFHSAIQAYLINKTEPDSTCSDKTIKLFESAIPQLQKVDKYMIGEKFCSHPLLYYRGKIDTLAIVGGELALIEWKTSAKAKPTLSATFDAPIQAAAYVGALNRDLGILGDSNKNISKSLIVVCYEDGSPATTHVLDNALLNRHWKLWQDTVNLLVQNLDQS